MSDPTLDSSPPGRGSAARPADRVDWLVSTPFFLVHLAALAGPLFVPFRWTSLLLTATVYLGGMVFVTLGYHRYFSHRSFKTSRAFQLLLAAGSIATAQKGVLWWAANHRHHHRHADDPEDVHSPTRRGFYWAHVGWVLARTHEATKVSLVADLAKVAELRWLDRHYLVPPVSLAVVMALAGGPAALYWGFALPLVLLWHGTFTINSLSHTWGRRRYATSDTSRNNPLLALITLGEGWHNNHHYYQASARQGFFWWEIDPSYYLLKLLEWVGLVWDVRTPPAKVLEARTG